MLRNLRSSFGVKPKWSVFIFALAGTAQGYVPVIGRDGSTLYLVQSARALRGGLAFVF